MAIPPHPFRAIPHLPIANLLPYRPGLLLARSAGWPALFPMQLRELVDKYLRLGGGYGVAVALDRFELPRDAAERLFGAFDEDYHISRFFHFTNAVGASYHINGFPCTHLSLDAEIQSIL